MNIEEIRKNAPDGATHYINLKNDVLYVRGQCVWHADIETWDYAIFDIMDIQPL